MQHHPPLVFEVTAESAGSRLDRFLAAQAAVADEGSPLFGASRAKLQRLIGSGSVVLDGASARPAQKLRSGQRIAVTVPAPEPVALVPEPMDLDIIYEDAHLIAVAKPAGLVVHPGAGCRVGTLVNALLAHCTDLSGVGGELRPGIVHRLDKGTSGVLVAAKHDRAHVALAGQFAARCVKKHYVAFVGGTPTPSKAKIETYYGRHPTDRKRFTSRVRSGRRAVTTYSVALTIGGVSMLNILLGTGRTHQIRVHLADRGHPILGDGVYGKGSRKRIRDPGLRGLVADLTRQALHASRLSLCHPIAGSPLVLEAALPEDLQALENAMNALNVTASSLPGNA